MTIEDQDPPEEQEEGAVRTGGRHSRADVGVSRADMVRLGLRGTGQTLITLGVVVLLFVVYELWVTNIFAQEKQHKVHSALEKWTASRAAIV